MEGASPHLAVVGLHHGATLVRPVPLEPQNHILKGQYVVTHACVSPPETVFCLSIASWHL